MKRIAVAILAGCSFLTALAAGALWIESYSKSTLRAVRIDGHPNWMPDPIRGLGSGTLTRYEDLGSAEGYWRAWLFNSYRGRLFVYRWDVQLGRNGGVLVFGPSSALLVSSTGIGPGDIIWPSGHYADLFATFPSRDQNLWTRAGFAIGRGEASVGTVKGTIRVVVLPFWLFVMLGLSLPLLCLAGYVRRRRRVAGGRCLTCGYDLRASPQRCPECGRAVL